MSGATGGERGWHCYGVLMVKGVVLGELEEGGGGGG